MSIRKIAQLAGVSTTTVSRVLNNHPYVTDDKREKVLSVMAEIDYVPNKNAINLSNGQSDVIGVVVPYTRNSCYDQLIESILEEATKNHKKVMLLPTYFDKKLEKEYYTLLRGKTVDGIIVSSKTHDDQFLKELNQFGSIITTEKTKVEDIISVYPDRVKIYHNLFNYIANLTTFDSLFITVTRPKKQSFSTEIKMNLFQEYFPFKKVEDSFISGISTYNDAYLLGKQLFKSNKSPIIYSNRDEVAAGFYQAATELGLKNRKDYYLIGEDNQLFSQMLSIDTVDFQLKTVGKTAVKKLLSGSKGNSVIDAEFIKRGINH
ncbi:LacI family DNA-binding transcriptional regulator [Vagococcus carniphilus]|uniref:LacI family DNA-binding transcriptional regulator n=1 Tax=Vagococcus carniphilus TaxID=218144 RepID=UPI00288F702B|nr:LacI family DNA-binding transcriptional regulator [Vagococcus carniphilus]MDT2847727.1 LacI family DNA-binding transcriptional regulator [Vagococcus carniphilus]